MHIHKLCCINDDHSNYLCNLCYLSSMYFVAGFRVHIHWFCGFMFADLCWWIFSSIASVMLIRYLSMAISTRTGSFPCSSLQGPPWTELPRSGQLNSALSKWQVWCFHLWRPKAFPSHTCWIMIIIKFSGICGGLSPLPCYMSWEWLGVWSLITV